MNVQSRERSCSSLKNIWFFGKYLVNIEIIHRLKKQNKTNPVCGTKERELLRIILDSSMQVLVSSASPRHKLIIKHKSAHIRHTAWGRARPLNIKPGVCHQTKCELHPLSVTSSERSAQHVANKSDYSAVSQLLWVDGRNMNSLCDGNNNNQWKKVSVCCFKQIRKIIWCPHIQSFISLTNTSCEILNTELKKTKKQNKTKTDNNKCSVLNLWIKINKQNLESWSENRMSGFMKQPIRLHWNCGSSNMY